MNNHGTRFVEAAMSDNVVIPKHEFIGRADTLPPPAESPWIDAPTHDGLWWVAGEGFADIAVFMLRRHIDDVWRITGMSYESIEELHPTWKFAPATPPPR